MLKKEDILKVEDLKRETVSVPEWGGEVIVRMLTGKERDQFEEWIYYNKSKDKTVNMKNMRARLCALTMIGDDGKRLFPDEDIDLLGQKSAKALDRVFSVAQKLNGIGASDVEELTKN